MMLFAGGGAGNDLLDFIPTDAYFKAAKVEMSVAALSAVLDEAEPAAAASRYSFAARRQMALRGLGELKDVTALAAIERFLRSPDPLTAEYAKAAKAAIEGKGFERSRPSEDVLSADLACLPSGLGAIGRMNADSGSPIDLAKLMEGGALPEGLKKADIEAQILEALGQVIARMGNFRLSAITFGVASEVGGNEGFVVMLVRGLYDHKALESMMGDRIGGVRMKEGGLVFHELDSDHAYVAPVSNELLVFVAGAARGEMPLAEIGAKVVAGGGDFAIGKELAKLLERTDTSAPLWAMAEVTESYKQAPILKPFDTLVLGSKALDTGKSKLTLKAKGGDPAAAKEVVEEMNKGLVAAIEQMDQAGKDFPGSGSMGEMLKSVKIEAAEGGSATLTAEMVESSVASMLPMMFFGAMPRAEVVAPPEVPEAQPAEEEAAE
jgi:hypothetical protein